jgi:hypothetical protein
MRAKSVLLAINTPFLIGYCQSNIHERQIFAWPAGLFVPFWADVRFSAKPCACGRLRLPSGKHTNILTYYQTIVNKKMTKKDFFVHPGEACHCLKIKKHNLRVQTDTFNSLSPSSWFAVK